jgi:5-methylthioribose kinase
VTEDLVFTEPFVDHPHNHWNPLVTDAVRAVWADEALLAAVADLKWAFTTRAEALIHGDLHTGSVMVTATDTRVIDPEFGFYGPMGFDVGALLANFALNYLAQPAWGGDPADVADYRRWLLEVSQDVWDGFAERFIGLWQEHGPAWTPPAYRRRYMARLFHDAVGFAGVKMIRRIIGLAHVADLDGIEDLARRAEAERAALAFARRLVVDREQMDGIGEFIDRLEAIDGTGASGDRP